jgi:excisionase family DNA binding protein
MVDNVSPLMSTAELAEYVGVPLQTVYKWNKDGTGPQGIRVGKYVRYRRVEVDAWLDQRTILQWNPR